MQVPPAFSAIKVDGNRAYDLARSGEDGRAGGARAQIDRLELVDMPDGDTAVFEADCGRGTYVRALARDMGRALGCLGHVIALRRTRVAGFSEDEAVTMQALQEAAEAGSDEVERLLLPIEAALNELAALPSGRTMRPGCCAGRPC